MVGAAGQAQGGGHRRHSRPAIQAGSGALLAVVTGAGPQLEDRLVRVRARGTAQSAKRGGGAGRCALAAPAGNLGGSMLDSFHCHLLAHGQPVNKVNWRPGRGRAGSSRGTLPTGGTVGHHPTVHTAVESSAVGPLAR